MRAVERAPSAEGAGASAAELARARAHLIFALDVPTAPEAKTLVRSLRGEVGLFKVGKELFVKEGPAIVRWIRARGAEIFLDLKFHDIPETVARASAAAASLGVAMLDLHGSGGLEMMRATRTAVDRACRSEGLRRPRLLAVTVLTSLSAPELERVGVPQRPSAQVLRLARLARSAGMDGVVTSALEAASVRRACGPRFDIVTPGIRPGDASLDDQKRAATPHAATLAGADHLVVGRPIRDAADPRAAARAIVVEIAGALRARRAGSTRRSAA